MVMDKATPVLLEGLLLSRRGPIASATTVSVRKGIFTVRGLDKEGGGLMLLLKGRSIGIAVLRVITVTASVFNGFWQEGA